MFKWEVIERAAERKCAAAHRSGIYRLRWDEEQGRLVFQKLDFDEQLWKEATREEVLAKWPDFGWHTGRKY